MTSLFVEKQKILCETAVYFKLKTLHEKRTNKPPFTKTMHKTKNFLPFNFLWNKDWIPWNFLIIILPRRIKFVSLLFHMYATKYVSKISSLYLWFECIVYSIFVYTTSFARSFLCFACRSSTPLSIFSNIRDVHTHSHNLYEFFFRNMK